MIGVAIVRPDVRVIALIIGAGVFIAILILIIIGLVAALARLVIGH